MYVPPFVPQPIEIPGNVAQEPYLARLGFVRRVAVIHVGTVIITGAMAFLPLPTPKPAHAALLVLAMLVLLSIVRAMAKGRLADQRLSALILPVLLLTLALWLRGLYEQGWGVWGMGVGVACAAAYTLLCGRDLSFVGMFVLALSASSAIIAAIEWRLRSGGLSMASTLILNGAFLFYYVYDLAALLTRRRLDEEWGAVVDLYRDVLNGLTYPIRVYQHWRENNIWSPPKEWFR
jgi:hypothetical protein